MAPAHAAILVADMIPPPSRPRWDDPPAPLPLPPELLAALLVALAFAVGWYLRARRAKGAV